MKQPHVEFWPKVHLDALCVVPDSGLDFECYGLDPKRRRLTLVGRIFND
ncbi:MAG: hypothetical protein V4505_13895 [Pseudomonadota bacterium]